MDENGFTHGEAVGQSVDFVVSDALYNNKQVLDNETLATTSPYLPNWISTIERSGKGFSFRCSFSYVLQFAAVWSLVQSVVMKGWGTQGFWSAKGCVGEGLRKVWVEFGENAIHVHYMICWYVQTLTCSLNYATYERFPRGHLFMGLGIDLRRCSGSVVLRGHGGVFTKYLFWTKEMKQISRSTTEENVMMKDAGV